MKNRLAKKVLGIIYKVIILPVVRKFHTLIPSQIPTFEINEVHIINARLLTTREEMLKLLPGGGVVAELGVDEGDFSESILHLNKPGKLHLIDFWGSKRYNQEKRKKVEARFSKYIEEKKLEINRGLSTDVVHSFPDNYFDWIYIDTAHTYKTTINELEAYRKKVKPSGIIAGHDYILGNWNGMVRYGVIEAVYEFCVKYSWEILFLTAELANNPSFAIRPMADKNLV